MSNREQKSNFSNLSLVQNPIAMVLEAEAEDRYCQEETYFDAICLVCNDVQNVPLLTIAKVFVNLARKFAHEGNLAQALETLDGLAFVLRQFASKNAGFSASDLEIIHYECFLDVEYASLGEVRFARERTVNRIKELNHKRSQSCTGMTADRCWQKCFETLDEIDTMHPANSATWRHMKPFLKQVECLLGSAKPRISAAAERRVTA